MARRTAIKNRCVTLCCIIYGGPDTTYTPHKIQRCYTSIKRKSFVIAACRGSVLTIVFEHTGCGIIQIENTPIKLRTIVFEHTATTKKRKGKTNKMANTTGPLLSLSASGKFGGSLVYVCGEKVRKTPTIPTERTPAQKLNQTIWMFAAEVWSQKEQSEKDAWNAFYIWTRNVMCGKETFSTPLNGFNAWMKFIVKLGVGGWPNAPYPPGPSPQQPPQTWAYLFN